MERYKGQETCAQIVHWEDEFYKADEVDAVIAKLISHIKEGLEEAEDDDAVSDYNAKSVMLIKEYEEK